MTSLRPLRFGRESEYNVVMSCPGCDLWQIDYTDEVAQTYCQIEMVTIEELGSAEPINLGPTVDSSPWYALVESLLQDHYDECVHLRRLMGEL